MSTLADAVRAALRGERPGRKTREERARVREHAQALGLFEIDVEARAELGDAELRATLAAFAEIDATVALEILVRTGGLDLPIDPDAEEGDASRFGLVSVRSLPALSEPLVRDLASLALGLARAAHRAAASHAENRVQFGAPIARLGAIEAKLARMQVECDRLAASIPALDAAGLASVAARAVVAVTHESLQIHGGIGYTADAPVESFYRDALELSAWLTAAARRAVPSR